MKKRPFGVILLDNVDRAHPAVIDLLIEILRHGRVLDGQRNTVYFTDTLIVMTSNVVGLRVPSVGLQMYVEFSRVPHERRVES